VRKYGKTLTFCITDEQYAVYLSLLNRYHCNFGTRSNSERFRKLLARLNSPYDRNTEEQLEAEEAPGARVEHAMETEAEGEDPDAVLEGEPEDDPDADMPPDEDPDAELPGPGDDPDVDEREMM
jgi:hypothetical protein